MTYRKANNNQHSGQKWHSPHPRHPTWCPPSHYPSKVSSIRTSIALNAFGHSVWIFHKRSQTARTLTPVFFHATSRRRDPAMFSQGAAVCFRTCLLVSLFKNETLLLQNDPGSSKENERIRRGKYDPPGFPLLRSLAGDFWESFSGAFMAFFPFETGLCRARFLGR